MTEEGNYRNKFLDHAPSFMIQWGMDPHCLYRRLEQRFEGEIPDHLRRAALAGGAGFLEGAAARAASRTCDDLALAAQHEAARRRAEPRLLPGWRTQGLAWRRRLLHGQEQAG
jgi:hypothetical protein